MNKINVLLAIVPVLYYSQTGKVGINTETPTEVLDVNGNGRYRKLNDGTSSSQRPLYTKNVIADNNGVLGWGNLPKALYSRRNFALPGDIGKRRVTVNASNGFNEGKTYNIISGFNFDLKKGQIITISYSIPFVLIKNTNDSQNSSSEFALDDNFTRIINSYFIFRNTTNNQTSLSRVALSSQNITSSSSGYTGLYWATGSDTVEIPEDGRWNVSLTGEASISANHNGFIVEYSPQGGSITDFATINIISHN